MDLVKSVVNEGSVESVVDVRRKLQGLFSTWGPDLDHVTPPALIDVLAVQKGENDPAVVEARHPYEAQREEITLAEDLALQQRSFLFELTAWQLRRVRHGEPTPAAVAILKLLSDSLTSVQEISQLFDKVVGEDGGPASTRLNRWVLSELAAAHVGEGPFPTPGAMGDLTAGFLFLLLLATHPQAGPPAIEATEGLSSVAPRPRRN